MKISIKKFNSMGRVLTPVGSLPALPAGDTDSPLSLNPVAADVRRL